MAVLTNIFFENVVHGRMLFNKNIVTLIFSDHYILPFPKIVLF